MKVRHAALAITAAVSCIYGGCGNSGGGSPGSAGSTNSTAGKATGSAGNPSASGMGGSSAGGPATTCTPAAVTACGGSLVGSWTVASSCLSVSGAVDAQKQFGLSCPTGQMTANLNVTGTFSAKADGSFTDGTTTTGPAQITLPAECLNLSGTTTTCDKIAQVIQGFDALTCLPAASGGCSCSGNLNQMGSMGVMTQAPNTDGFLATANNTITITQDNSQYSYCVSGSSLTVTPQSTLPVIAGTIALQGSTAAGAGGAGGSPGAAGMAGTPSSAGAGPSGGSSSGGQPGAGGAGTGTKGEGPCDIYAAANVPCGAAYSMVRSLSSKYTGPLYQVRNGSSSSNTGTGGMTKDIPMTADGYADSAVQDAFCSGSVCTVSVLYDQSGNKNDLTRGSAGKAGNGTRSGEDDYESSATKLSVTAGGHKVYALYMAQYEGYRTPLNVKATGVALGNKDQGVYELADGTHYGTQCCWDFGAVSPDPNTYVTMNTLFFGKGFWGTGAGSGPWFMGDFEGGVWAGGTGASTVANASSPAMAFPFALGILHTPVGKYALRMADISTAADLTTAYDGAIVSGKTWGNAGGIVLGVGGDNSNNSWGTFYEGAVTNGSPTNATDLLIMKNIQAVGYKK